jgi:2-polyprenyl-6-methoxyphenol hydroxylase-like FAD-dependent oxidoreductase
MSHQRILDHTGRQLAEIELSTFWNPVGHCVGIERGELHRILLEGAAGVPIRLGSTLTMLSQENDEVNVDFADGSTGKYDLVVGADGIHSTIRQLAFWRHTSAATRPGELAFSGQPLRRDKDIGDAAHATSPNMAEGASMALEDALVLAQMLATHGSAAEALSAFGERRSARIRWVRQRTRRRDRIRTLPAPIRNLALRLAGTALYRRDYQPLLDEP